MGPGLWDWQAPHPQWRPTEPWSENVSYYAIDDDERLLLFDSLGVPSEIEALAAGRETAIVITAPWHERDAQSLVERLGRVSDLKSWEKVAVVTDQDNAEAHG